jgi:Tol biopolymer transport system component
MPDVKEIYALVERQVEPDLHAWNHQERRQRRSSSTRRLGAFTVVGALVIATVVATTGPIPNTDGAGTDGPWPDRGGSAAYALVDLEGEGSTPLASQIDGGMFYSASPDGRRLAMSPWPNPIRGAHQLAVYVSNADGSDVHRITPPGVDAIGPRWSPDGRRIVYQGRDDGTLFVGDLFVVDAASGDVTRVTDLPRVSSNWWFMSPSLSVDGKTIVFHMPRRSTSGRWDLWSVPVTGGEPTLVRRDAAYGTYLADGSIAFLEEPRYGSLSPPAGLVSDEGIWIVEADGSDPRPLLERGGVYLPIASPDGTKIAYQTRYEIRVVDALEVARGSTLAVIEGTSPFWLDDDTLIAQVSE